MRNVKKFTGTAPAYFLYDCIAECVDGRVVSLKLDPRQEYLIVRDSREGKEDIVSMMRLPTDPELRAKYAEENPEWFKAFTEISAG